MAASRLRTLDFALGHEKADAGTDYVLFAIGELTVIALPDGYVDMPPSRLRQSGDRPFGSDLPTDHVNGLVAADGSDAFPNLDRLFVPQEEIPLFDSIDRVARFRQRRLPFGDGFSLSPSVTAVPAHGHEVGHTVFEVSSAGETLYFVYFADLSKISFLSTAFWTALVPSTREMQTPETHSR